MFISQGNGWLFLQSGNLGAGELWFIPPTTNKGFFTIRCFGIVDLLMWGLLVAMKACGIGAEQNMFLQSACGGSTGDVWPYSLWENHHGGFVAMILSHALR